MKEKSDSLFLCISIRGSERVASLVGGKLDKLQYREGNFTQLLHGIFGACYTAENSCYFRDQLLLQCSTAIFADQFERLFSVAKVLKTIDAIVDISVDSVKGNYCLLSCVCMVSSADCLESVEGDDLVFVLMLEKSSLPPTTRLDKRPTTPNEAITFINNLGVVTTSILGHLSDRFRPGFYLVNGRAEDEKLSNFGDDEKIAVDPSAARVALCSGTAYFFYCWLICQRLERNLLSVSANGEWEEEFRKMLLVKKQLIAARKTALLKNRAFPGSLLLKQLKQCIESFRLEDQLSYLTEQAEQTSKALEAQNAYVTSSRIRSIETIIFISTVLGLAVALNAIQMPPFFDPGTQNALSRPVFWFVFIAVICGAFLLMGTLSQSHRIRKLLKWIKSRISRK